MSLGHREEAAEAESLRGMKAEEENKDAKDEEVGEIPVDPGSVNEKEVSRNLTPTAGGLAMDKPLTSVGAHRQPDNSYKPLSPSSVDSPRSDDVRSPRGRTARRR